MRRPTTRYKNKVIDSARWDDIELRDGDIVVSTPVKCGTTWTQMICALLIFQSADLPRPLDSMSVWPDFLLRRPEEVAAELAAQQHRRFIKTHLPLDGLPYDDRVTYVCAGRDPRDVAISWGHHMDNRNLPVMTALRTAALGPGEAGVKLDGLPDSTLDRFWLWVDNSSPFDGSGLSLTLHHLETFWQMRDQSNIVLLHYQEMQDDLEGTMRRLAARLGIEVPEEKWPELVRAANFGEMKKRADELAPEPGIWLDRKQFFYQGTSGQWRELLNADDLRRYEARVRELTDDPEFIDWAHRGQIQAPH
jgi:hypothetical protein